MVAAALCLLAVACAEPEDLGPALNTIPPAALPQRFYPPDGWAWGLIQVRDHPPHRYGVAGPREQSRGDIVIIPDVGEPAEAWFETVRDMTAAGWTVWVIDPASQGGSSRSVHPRDMRHVDDMAIDAEAAQHLLRIISADPRRRLVLLGQGLGAAHVIWAQGFDISEDIFILSGPFGAANNGGVPQHENWRTFMSAVFHETGLGAHYASGERGWTSSGSDGPAVRGNSRLAVPAEWMRANPQLRSGGASWSWISEEAVYRAETSASRTDAPVVVISASVASRPEQSWVVPFCAGPPRCTFVPLPASRFAPHLEVDAIRDVWLAAVLAAAEGAPLSPTPPRR